MIKTRQRQRSKKVPLKKKKASCFLPVTHLRRCQVKWPSENKVDWCRFSNQSATLRLTFASPLHGLPKAKRRAHFSGLIWLVLSVAAFGPVDNFVLEIFSFLGFLGFTLTLFSSYLSACSFFNSFAQCPPSFIAEWWVLKNKFLLPFFLICNLFLYVTSFYSFNINPILDCNVCIVIAELQIL